MDVFWQGNLAKLHSICSIKKGNTDWHCEERSLRRSNPFDNPLRLRA